MPAPTVIHYHIFKNAGSSIDHLLAECFGDAFAPFEATRPHDIIDTHRVQAFLAANPAIRAVTSHVARPPLPGPHCLPIAMLRHPIDRARAVFQYAQRTPSMRGHAEAARGFRNYVAWTLDTPASDVVMLNYQTIHLSGASFRTANILDATATATDLAQAQELLSGWPAFGLVREFEASCRLFEACYRPYLPALRLRPVRHNASPDGAPDEAHAIAATRAELGAGLFGRLAKANEFDLALYEGARLAFARLGKEKATASF
jgi:hypothetical protein